MSYKLELNGVVESDLKFGSNYRRAKSKPIWILAAENNAKPVVHMENGKIVEIKHNEEIE